jgi:hypothetical protein
MSLRRAPHSRPPPPDFHVAPTDEQVRQFRVHGFIAVERPTTDEELEWFDGVSREY